MGPIVYDGKTYNPQSLSSVYFEDVVSINGYIGYVDFVGADKLTVVAEDGVSKDFRYNEINESYLLRMGWLNPFGGRIILNQTKTISDENI